MRPLIIFLLMCSTAQAQTTLEGWDVVKAVPPGTRLRINSSIIGQLDSVDNTQITINGRRLIQDTIGRVERVIPGKRKRNAWIGFGLGAAFGATAMRVNGGNAFGMAWQGSGYGGLGALLVGAASKPSNVVIYQR